MELIAIHNATIQMIHAGIILLPLPVAYAARTRKRTNKDSHYSCINRPRDMALHTCFSKRIQKNMTSTLCRDIIALAQTISIARLAMQLISL
jgi:hypothetical protein